MTAVAFGGRHMRLMKEAEEPWMLLYIEKEVQKCARFQFNNSERAVGGGVQGVENFFAFHRQQHIEKVLTAVEISIESSAREASPLHDAGDGGVGVAVFTNNFGCGLAYQRA
ncbi:hypothetical protein [Camelimonas lactis]|uniref:hypothetical protein n=1 Tax=Camelimonas lactis TaxID=659006 RepID=UPI001FE06769|nr:hypothetical protein [Camelimonas lactis]